MKTFAYFLFILILFTSYSLHAKQFNALLFTKTLGWHHKSHLEGVLALREIARQHDFSMEWHEDASRINDDFLKQFDVIIFLSTTGDILNNAQQSAMEKFIRSGKGFVGIHSASDTEYQWPWYQKLVGRTFVIHPAIQTARLTVLDKSFPGLATTPDTYLWTDEFYQFSDENVQGLNYLLAVDESSYDPKADWGNVKGEGMGKFHPLAWYHNYDGGRAYYSALGHLPATYENKLFQQQLYGGIYWAATGKGMKK